MADQTPAEMREQASEIRDMAETWDEGLEAGELAAMRAGADALDALADVIEWITLDSHTPGASDGYAEALRDIGRIARGESTSHEDRRER